MEWNGKPPENINLFLWLVAKDASTKEQESERTISNFLLFLVGMSSANGVMMMSRWTTFFHIAPFPSSGSVM